MAINKTFNAIAILAALCIVTPFVWMKAVPHEGYITDPTSDIDVYIFGGNIFGKDRSFWGISFAYKFQLLTIFYFIYSTIRTRRKYEAGKAFALSIITNAFLLTCFPFWLEEYIDGVVCNSDSVYFNIYPHIGLVFYSAIVVLQGRLLWHLFYAKEHIH